MRTPFLLLISVALAPQKPPKPSAYPIAPVPIADVRITDGFWKTRLDTNRTVTIPHIMRQNELTGRIDNFLKAAKPGTGEYKGLEGIDNGGQVSNITLPSNAELTAAFDPKVLSGVTVIRGKGIMAIPYFAWNNRGKGEMEVWIPYGK